MTRTAVTPQQRDGAAAWLLDPHQVADLLAVALPGLPRPEDVEIDRCWPAGTDFLVQWSFRLGTPQRYVLYGRWSRAVTANAAPSENHPCLDGDELRGVRAELPEHQVVVHSPDRDAQLLQLADCLKADPIGPSIGAAGSAPALGQRLERTRLLGYKPGRRATVLYTLSGNPGTRILGKTHRKISPRHLQALHESINRELAAQPGPPHVRVSMPLGHLPALKLGLFEWADGESAAPAGRDLNKLVHAAGEVLVALHRVRVQGLPVFNVEQECAILQRWHAALRILDPSAAAAGQQRLDGLLEHGAAVDEGPRCLIHRDFYDKQYVWSSEGVTLLDLDTVAEGHPCVDLGNFLAHVLLLMLRAGESTERFEPLAAQLLQRYESSGGAVDSAALQFFTAGSLFRLGCLHALRTRTRPYARRMWELSASVPGLP